MVSSGYRNAVLNMILPVIFIIKSIMPDKSSLMCSWIFSGETILVENNIRYDSVVKLKHMDLIRGWFALF